jgi:hypothetical protein
MHFSIQKLTYHKPYDITFNLWTISNSLTNIWVSELGLRSTSMAKRACKQYVTGSELSGIPSAPFSLLTSK